MKMLSKITSNINIRMYTNVFSIYTSKLVKGESHLGQLTTWLVDSSMRRKSFLVTTNKLQIWCAWFVLVCISLKCNLLEIKLHTYLPTHRLLEGYHMASQIYPMICFIDIMNRWLLISRSQPFNPYRITSCVDHPVIGTLVSFQLYNI